MTAEPWAALLIAAALTGTAACSTAAGSSRPVRCPATCEAMLPGRTIQAWESVTVRDLRAYQYGGPVAHVPLEHAFAGAGAGQDGVWCWVRIDRTPGACGASSKGHGVGRAITMTRVRAVSRTA